MSGPSQPALAISVKRASVKPAQPVQAAVGALVLLNASNEDDSLGQAVAEVIDRNGVGYVMPLRAGEPAEIRQDLEQRLLESDGVIIVYGAVTHTWARNQVLHCHKFMSLRQQPLKALALYEGPPEEKEDLRVKLPGMQILNCRKYLDENLGLDHRVGHPVPFDLPHGSPRRTEGSRGYLDSSQYGRKHRARFLPEKPFRRGRAIRAREQKVVHGREARALSRVVKPSQLVISQREIPVTSFHIRAGALEHLRERFGLMLELRLLQRAQCLQYSTGRKQRGAEARGQFTQWHGLPHRPRGGHAVEVV